MLSIRPLIFVALCALPVAAQPLSAQAAGARGAAPPAGPPAAPSANGAQATIANIFPTGATVELRRVGASTTQSAKAGVALQTGDQLSSKDPQAMLELRCAAQSSTVYRLQGPFRTLIDTPVNGVCHVNILSGRGEVIAETPTATTGGGVGMISRGTQYSLNVTGEGDSVTCHLVVFEGEVGLRSGAPPILQGSTADWIGPTKSRAKVAVSDIESSAALNARFDVYAARAIAPTLDTVATFRDLRQLHIEMLSAPTDASKRVSLAKKQITLKVDDQAGYNLKQAHVTSDSALRSNQIDPALIRARPALRGRILGAEATVLVTPPVRKPPATSEVKATTPATKLTMPIGTTLKSPTTKVLTRVDTMPRPDPAASPR